MRVAWYEGYFWRTMQENVENRGTDDWVAEARSMLQLGFEALGREDYDTLTLATPRTSS